MCIHLSEFNIGAAIPPDTDTNAFQDVPLESVTLRPPTEAVNLYITTPIWNQFGLIGVR